MENFSWLTFMDAVPEKDEFLALKKELTKLRLEAKLRKSLSAALLGKNRSQISLRLMRFQNHSSSRNCQPNSRNTCHRRYTNKSSVGNMMLK